MDQPVETSEFVAFAKIVESKSLSRAARELGIPRATISRRLARLEQRLGARLLRRTTRSLAVTDAGEALYRHARIVLDAVSDAEASVRQTDQAVRGSLRVSVPPMMPESFRSMLCSFAESYPEVRMQVHFSSQLVDLSRDGYDVAVRASSELEAGLIARTLAREPMLAVAAPAYLARHGVPRTRRDLRQHRCLMGFARGEVPQSHWSVASGGKLHVDGAFSSNDVLLLGDAAVRGLGIAFLPLVAVHRHLESGALVQVLAGTLSAEVRIAVVYPERQFVPPPVRAFVEAVVAWAPEALGQKLPGQCREAARQRAPVSKRAKARKPPTHRGAGRTSLRPAAAAFRD